jgi:hypothetical protein
MDETPKPAKKSYSTPKLITYGNVTTLTRANVLIGRKVDGGGKLKAKSNTN